MDERITELSVGELARAAGVSVRTLHHYDAVGLLRPRWTAPSGCRFYGAAEAERLQEILFYREVGMGLSEIGEALAEGARADRLRAHRTRLAEAIETLDRTIESIERNEAMTTEDLYRPFAPERQADHEAWLTERYGAEMAEAIAASEETGEAPTPERMEALREIEAALVAAYEGGARPGDRALDGALQRHREWTARVWGRPCGRQAHAGLADIYEAHPDFVARFERLSPGFPSYLIDAMRAAAR